MLEHKFSGSKSKSKQPSDEEEQRAAKFHQKNSKISLKEQLFQSTFFQAALCSFALLLAKVALALEQ